MNQRFKDYQHLFRLGLLFIGCLVVFVVLRAIFIPEGFGEIGHFRTGAIDDNARHPMMHAGRASCAECHEDMALTLTAGAHAEVGCESCHGPLGMHAEDPMGLTPELPDVEALCAICHRTLKGRPADFPQVDIEEHAMGMTCIECHNPHNPGE